MIKFLLRVIARELLVAALRALVVRSVPRS
jgi:hypothetical protein